MNDRNFHARMMNISIPDHFNSDEDRAAGLRVTYRLGHMDARHAAAEIASEADAEIRRLVRLLDEERRTVTKMGHRLIEAHDERYILREQIRSLREQVDEANATMSEKAARSDRWLDASLAGGVPPGSFVSIGGLGDDDRRRFARAIEEARGWLRRHDGGEWRGWSCAVLTGSQEVSSPGWYALPPGQWCGQPCIVIERVERDGLELPTVAEAVAAWGVPAKVEE